MLYSRAFVTNNINNVRVKYLLIRHFKVELGVSLNHFPHGTKSLKYGVISLLLLPRVVVEGEDPMTHFVFTSSSLPLLSTPQHSPALPSTAQPAGLTAPPVLSSQLTAGLDQLSIR